MDKAIEWKSTRPAWLIVVLLLSAISMACAGLGSRDAIDPSEDSPRQRAMVDTIARTLAGPMQARGAQKRLLLSMDELYSSLSEDQQRFLDAIRHLEGADPELGVAKAVDWVRIDGQRVLDAGEAVGEQSLGLQLLPRGTAEAYFTMNAAMRADLGRGLAIGSGYRSPANQLFVFVSYMHLYAYSPAKTKVHVSLPGASDHNRTEHQGIDFVSEAGVDRQYSDPVAFKALDEYRWLVEHASRFNFFADEHADASPWHWSHDTTRGTQPE